MLPICCDVETTIFQNGNPYAQRNKLCYIGMYDGGESCLFRIEYSEQPYNEALRHSTTIINKYNLFVAFNAKFDIAWLRRYGIEIPKHMQVFDLQLVEFIITGQENPFPSLDDTCKRVGIAGKSGDIASRYWNQGIDTTEIPSNELEEYLQQDLRAEWELFQWQLKYLEDKPQLKRLCWDACQDFLVTQEMEHNGLFYDLELSKQIGDAYNERIKEIDLSLASCVCQPVANWNSGDWISCVLYGGTCQMDITEEFEFEYKDGRTATKHRKAKLPITFPRLVEPLKGTELKKQGFFSTDEGTLRRLRCTGISRKIVELMLERNKIEKKVGTYFHGIPKLYGEMDWTNSVIHGQLNHARAKTGRLSSSHPNQQNLDPECRRCIKTRFLIS